MSYMSVMKYDQPSKIPCTGSRTSNYEFEIKPAAPEAVGHYGVDNLDDIFQDLRERS